MSWERVLTGVLVVAAAGAAGWLLEQGVRWSLQWLIRRLEGSWVELFRKALRGLFTATGVLVGILWLLEWLAVGDPWRHRVHQALLVLGVLVGSVFVYRLAVGTVKKLLHQPESGIPAVSIIANLVRLGVLLVAALVVLQVLGIPITPALTALGIGGLAVALALQDTLSNLFAGLQILAARQIRPGDFVRLDNGDEGVVQDISWRNTLVVTLAGNTVIIPNSRLANTVVLNYQIPQPSLSVLVPVQVAYTSDLERVERITLEVARTVQQEVNGAVREFEPLLRYQSFGESGINFTVILRAEDFSSVALLRHELIKRLYRRYREEGIEIPFPHRRLEGSLSVQLPPRGA
jgi:small-conductance mechanosensitive channel